MLGLAFLLIPLVALGSVGVKGEVPDPEPTEPLLGPDHFGCVCQQTCPAPDTRTDEILDLLRYHSRLLERQAPPRVPTPGRHGQETCDVVPEQRQECGYPGISEQECLSRTGCCFNTSITETKWCFHSHPEMQMIFRASAGSGSINLYHLWTSSQSMNANSQGLLTVDSSVRGVYKSALVEQWNRIEQVKVVLYNGGGEAFNMVFNAENTDKMSWFSADHLVSSSYTDLATATPLFFSILGDSQYGRRFFIHNNYGGCPSDVGWFVVLDAGQDTRPCAWDQEALSDSERPTFLYSPGTSMASSNDMVQGDVLVFYTKVKHQ